MRLPNVFCSSSWVAFEGSGHLKLSIERGEDINVVEFPVNKIDNDEDIFDIIVKGLEYRGRCDSWLTASELDAMYIGIDKDVPIVFWIRGRWGAFDCGPAFHKLLVCVVNFSHRAEKSGWNIKLILSED